MLFERIRQKQLKLKQMIFIALALIIAMVASAAVYASQVKEVQINHNGNKLTVKTTGKTVGEVLKDCNIKVGKNDVVIPGVDSVLSSNGLINIKEPVLQAKKTERLDIGRIVIAPKFEDNLKPKDNILKDKEVVKEKVINVKSKLAYKVKKRSSTRLAKGETRVVKRGKSGMVQKQYKIYYRNGKEVRRELLCSKVVSKPVDKIIEVGTVSMLLTSRGDTVRYKRVMVMRATAYDNSFQSTGKSPQHPDYGVTATGMRTRKGLIAVDPSVIPLGSRLYIESMQRGVPSYGYAIAADTGGAIKGNIVDLFFSTRREANNWGVRRVKVYVLE